MNANRVLIIMAFVAGMLGGILSSSFISNINCEMITAQYIRLVDNEGNALIKLYATPKFTDDLSGSDGAHIELYNDNGSLFSSCSTQTQSLSFHDRDNVNQAFTLGPKVISLNDGNVSRLTLGFVRNQKTREKYGLEPYTMVVFDEDLNVLWSAP